MQLFQSLSKKHSGAGASSKTETDVETTESVVEYVGKNKRLGFGNFSTTVSQVANVLLVGRSQTGKTSLLTALQAPHRSVTTTGYSATKKPQFLTLVVRDTKDPKNVWYHLNIFDTPGLGETRADAKETRNDDELLQLTQLCVENQVTHLNFIGFVTVAGETALLDLNVFGKIRTYLGDESSKISSIILTKCDKKTKEDLDALKRTVQRHETTRSFAEYCKLGMDCFGSVNVEQCEALAAGDEANLKRIVRNKLSLIEQWRDNLLYKILKSAKSKHELEENSKVWGVLRNAEEAAVRQVTDNLTERLERQNSRLKRGELRKYADGDEHIRSVADYLDPADKNLGIGRFEVRKTRRINVLLVGRSQVGKSTIVQTLKDPQVTLRSAGFSQTRDSRLHSLVVCNEKTHNHYQLNIVDTPGLGERLDKGGTRTNQEIMDVVKVFLKHQIKKLNVIVFASKAGQTSMLDIGAFKELIGFLGPDSRAISMMVLTHCDEWTDSKLKAFEDSLSSHPDSSGLVDHCALGIKRIGAVNIGEIRATAASDLNPKDCIFKMVQAQLLRIEKLREELFSTIVACEDELLLAQLDAAHTEVDSSKQRALFNVS